jgi:hypothetical protein
LGSGRSPLLGLSSPRGPWSGICQRPVQSAAEKPASGMWRRGRGGVGERRAPTGPAKLVTHSRHTSKLSRRHTGCRKPRRRHDGSCGWPEGRPLFSFRGWGREVNGATSVPRSSTSWGHLQPEAGESRIVGLMVMRLGSIRDHRLALRRISGWDAPRMRAMRHEVRRTRNRQTLRSCFRYDRRSTRGGAARGVGRHFGTAVGPCFDGARGAER